MKKETKKTKTQNKKTMVKAKAEPKRIKKEKPKNNAKIKETNHAVGEEKVVKTKNVEKEKMGIKGIIFLTLMSLLTIGAIVFHDHIFGADSVFYRAISSNAVINAAFCKIPSIIRTIEIITISYLFYLLLKFTLSKLLKKNNKEKTIVKLLTSFLKYTIALVAVFMILNAWGVDTYALLASAGILGLVIGLGAQSLIADIIAGVFIVFEGVYQVGDIVVVGDWRGMVDEIGIRTTKIIDTGGNIKIINNSEISAVVNQTKELSLAKSVISIEYSESIEKVELVIKNNLEKIKENIPEIIEGPYYKGVECLNSSSVDLLFFARCKENDIYSVQRAMNRELKLMFDRNNITVPFPQVTVSKFVETKHTISEKNKKEAMEFVLGQRGESKDVEYKNE